MKWRPEDEKARDRLRLWCSSNLEPELARMLQRATSALRKEDARIHKTLANSEQPAAYKRCGHGLSYWVFEHNLVYPIFLEWARTHVVHWDEHVVPTSEGVGRVRRDELPDERKRPAKGESPKRSEWSATRSLIDLQVKLADEMVRLEAKWWVTDAAQGYVTADARKIRNICRDKGGRALLLTFWYGLHEERGKDLDNAGEVARDMKSEIIFAGTFDSMIHVPKRWNKGPEGLRQGYFTMVALDASPRRSTRQKS